MLSLYVTQLYMSINKTLKVTHEQDFNCCSSSYTHQCCEFKLRSWRGVLDTTLFDKVCQWLATGRWFSQCPIVSSTNKTDSHDITEILLKVALNTINQTYLIDKILLIDCCLTSSNTLTSDLFNIFTWYFLIF